MLSITQIGRYEIRRKLGAGGMGEVYLAHDQSLGRDVALKVLPAEFSNDADRLTRFKQEARAISALNHPNILTIYEIGESEHGLFIATELVNGETLRDLINREKSLPVAQAARIAEQIADALVAAHEANIVHRDIKPENVMIRRDGYVKVLDFGLAKPLRSEAASEDATVQIAQTTPGMVMGSVRYMSPEQARGKDVDERTDLWSLGIVLFEMVTGKAPFDGETMSDTLAALIYKEAQPIVEIIRDAPADLNRIIRKALRKDKNERYQSARELASDLRDFRDDYQHHKSGEVHRAASNIGGNENQTAMLSVGGVPTETNRIHQTNSTGAAEVHLTNSTNQTAAAESVTAHFPSQTGGHQAATAETSLKKRNRLPVFAAVTAFMLLAAVGVGAYFYWNAKPTNLGATAFSTVQVSRLNANGKVRSPAISPDGKYVAFVGGETGNFTLVVRQMATESAVTIVPPTPLPYAAVVFSPDGNYVYYLQLDKSNSLGTLYQIPTLGGTPKQIAHDVDSAPTFAPDGKKLSFMRNSTTSTADRTRTIFICNSDGTDLQPLLTTKDTAYKYFISPAWSPDNQKIAVIGGKNITTGGEMEILEIALADKTTKPIGTKKYRYINNLAWFRDGSGLVFVGMEAENEPLQIWRALYPSGDALRITNDLNNYSSFSLSGDGATIVALKSESISSLWNFVAANKELKQLSPESRTIDGYYGMQQMPNENLLLVRYNDTESNIWTTDINGQNARQLTSGAKMNIYPTLTPNKQFIVFNSSRSGVGRIWRINADGSNPIQLTANDDGGYESFSEVTPDSKTVMFQKQLADGKVVLMRAPVEGGAAAQIFEGGGYDSYPRLAPDGKHLAFVSYEPTKTKQLLRVAKFDGENVGKITKEVDFNLIGNFVWSPDGKSLTYLSRDGVPNLWRMPLDENVKPQPITDFKSGNIFNFTWSRDGKSLFLARGVVNTDLVLIKSATAKS